MKIVQDAYDGTLTFYDADPTDPIVRAYEGVFPGMFHPLTEMPADLQTHLRVPEELFDVQTRQYATYHITDPGTLFYKSDVWTVPSSSGSDQGLPPEAYYVVMRLPDAPEPEFLLLQPMVPASRPNMIAWVAARNDGAQRGTELVSTSSRRTRRCSDRTRSRRASTPTRRSPPRSASGTSPAARSSRAT